MTRTPNGFQKLLHRILMRRPITAFAAPRVHHIDEAIWKLTQGKFTLSATLGWNIIQLTTKGAKTNQPRTIPLVGVFDCEKIALIASSFGRKHNPGWYYNLKAHPECEVQFTGRSGRYIAREASGQEYDRYWQMAVSLYEGYDRYKQRATQRHIPVMILEPKT